MNILTTRSILAVCFLAVAGLGTSLAHSSDEPTEPQSPEWGFVRYLYWVS